MEANNIALIQQLFTYFGEKKIPEFLGMFSQDAVWVEPGDEKIPYSGSYTGIAGITKLLTILSQSLQVKSFTPTQFVGEGNSVVVIGDNNAIAIPTGKSYTTKWVYSFTIQDQKVVRLEVFMDTQAIANAVTA